MQRPTEWQREFAKALLNPEVPPPISLTDPSGRRNTRRFAVYRNNVIWGLVEALRDSYPVTCRIVGAEFFDAMARIYAFRNPPRSPILLEYGGDFADFVSTFGPANSIPYLSDVCKIERLWLEAYHAPEAVSLKSDELPLLSISSCSGLHLVLHPSLRLVSSEFPAVTIWSTNIEGSEPVPVDLTEGGESALIVRPGAEVEVFVLSETEAAFIQAIAHGATVMEAAKMSGKVNSQQFAESAVGQLLDRGIIVDYSVASTPYFDLRPIN